MAIKDSIINLIIRAKNAVSPAADAAASSLYDAQKKADGLTRELKSLEAASETLDAFKQLDSESAATATALKEAQLAVAKLQNEMKATKSPSAELRANLANAKTEAQLAASAFKRNQTELGKMSRQLKRAGIDSRNLSGVEATLKNRIEQTSAKVKQSALSLQTYASKAKEAAREAGGFGGAVGSLKGLILGAGAGLAVKGLIDITDQYKSLRGELNVVSGSQEELNSSWKELVQLTNETRVPLESTVNLYARLKRSNQNLNLSQSQLLTFTKAINQAFVVSGASSGEASQAIIQLSQSMAKGVLNGDELRSVMEQAPRLSIALADGLGVSIGALKNMGAAGTLTAEKVAQAMLKMSGSIQADFDKMPETVGQALTKLKTKMIDAFGGTNTDELTQGIKEFGDAITDPAVAQGIQQLGAALFRLAGFMARVTSATVTFVKTLSEDLAAVIGGIALNDIPRLTARVKELHDALETPAWEKYGRRVLSVVQPWTLVFQSQRDAWKSTRTLSAELQKQQRDLELGTKIFGAAAEAAKKSEEATKAKTKAEKFATEILGEMTAAQDKATAAATAGQKEVSDAYKQLGIDQQKVLTGISSGASKSLHAFGTIAASLNATADDAAKNAEVMGLAFESALSAADTKGALDALAAGLKNAFASGIISAEQYQAELDKVMQKRDQLNKHLQDQNTETQKNTQTTQENTDANQKNADSIDEQGQALARMFNPAEVARGKLAEVSQAAADYFDTINASVNKGVKDVGTYFDNTAKIAERVTGLVNDQQAAVSQAMSMQNGDLASFISYAQRALTNASLLGDQQLSGLRSALEGARQQMQGLTNDAENTLNSLQQQLATLRGDTAEAQRLQFEQKKADLQAKIDSARKAGNRDAVTDLQQSLTVLAQIQQAQQQKARREAATQAAAARAPAPQETSAKAPINITLKGDRSHTTATVAASSQEQANALLKVLEEAGLRTT